ncbi:hypothetical protein BH23GEM7_BH23GEM7_30290 [soil metagenome]
MKRPRGSCLLVAAALTGCSATVTAIPLGEPSTPRPRGAEIRIYSVKTPDCPYEEISLLTAYRHPMLGVTTSRALEALKRRTRQLGGDAIVGLTTVSPTEHTADGIKGTAIRFTDASCRMDLQEAQFDDNA